MKIKIKISVPILRESSLTDGVSFRLFCFSFASAFGGWSKFVVLATLPLPSGSGRRLRLPFRQNVHLYASAHRRAPRFFPRLAEEGGTLFFSPFRRRKRHLFNLVSLLVRVLKTSVASALGVFLIFNFKFPIFKQFRN